MTVTDAQIDAAEWAYQDAYDGPGTERQAMRAAIAAADAAAWQPIETAPGDGSRFLVEGGTVYFNGNNWISDSAQRALQWEPTLWRPLPECPK